MAFTERYLRAADPIEVAGRQIKCYDVNVRDTAVDGPVRAAARSFLPVLLPEVDETPPAGFVVLHRGAGAAYLNAYSWVWDNVIECRTAAAGLPLIGCPDDDPTHFSTLTRPWIGCVWELPPLEHERSAWVRHMLVPEVADLDGYLADMLPDGPVGAPRG